MSKSYKLQLIDDSNFDVSLEKVRFENADVPEGLPADAEIRLRTKDSYKIKKITNDRLELEFKREKFFEPAAFFAIEVVLSIGYTLRPSENGDKKKIIEDDLKNESFRLLTPVTTRASMIISSLTSVDFKVPIVDPPYFLEEDDE